MTVSSSRFAVRLVPLLMLAAGCDFPGRPDPAYKFVAPDKVTDFAALYGKNCAACHGAQGKMGPAPPLNDPVFLAIVPGAELIKAITDGRAGTSMPAFADTRGGTLTAEQIRILAAGIRTHWKTPSPASKDWPAYLASGKGDAKRGEDLFRQACAACHGADGKGTKNGGPINDPVFLDLASEQMLRRIVITGRPDLNMPDCNTMIGPGDARPLESVAIDDLVALMMSWKSK